MRKWDRVKFFMKKISVRIYWFFLILFFLTLILFLFRYPLARGLASWMIFENQMEQADAIIVLGGNTWDRSGKALELYHAGYAPLIITSGGNSASPDSVATGNQMTEASLTRLALIKRGCLEENIFVLEKGTSTQEEAIFHSALCAEKGFKKVIVVSDKLHLRRINWCFREKMEKSGVKLILVGVSNSKFDEMEWWRTEEGMMMMTNECMKNIYYRLKY